MKDEQFERIKSYVEKGALRFILIKGVLLFGVIMFIANNLLWPIAHDIITINSVVFSFVLWSVSGILFGYINWCLAVRMYKNELEKCNANH